MCRGPECGDKRGSRGIYDAFRSAITEFGVADTVEIRWQSCFGRCTQGPNTLVREVLAEPNGAVASRFVFAALPTGRRSLTALYNRLTPDDARVLVEEHVVGGKVVRRLIERPARLGASGTAAELPSADTGD